jgi:DNA-binding Xre family transcriptional regulator
MNKGQHISMESLIRICDALDCELKDVVELVKAEE